MSEFVLWLARNYPARHRLRQLYPQLQKIDGQWSDFAGFRLLDPWQLTRQAR